MKITRNQKILIGVGVLAVAFTLYKVMQRKTISKPKLVKKGKTNFSDEEGTRYNEYGTPFVRPNKF